MVSVKIRITDVQGIHLRPAMAICEEAQRYQAVTLMQVRDVRVDLKGMFNILAAGVRKGELVAILCEGDGEAEALAGLKSVFFSIGSQE